MADETQAPISKRYKTLSLDKIDADYVATKVLDQWRYIDRQRDSYMQAREQWTAMWRDLRGQPRQGPWENSSNFHVPMIFTYGKAIHARLWQLFSDFDRLFGVQANQEVFQEREPKIKQFMGWILSKYANNRLGTKDVFDEWLHDNVYEGSGFLKCYWGRQVSTFLDVVPVTQVTSQLSFDRENLVGVNSETQKVVEKEIVRTEVLETPQIRRILLEDILMPVGQSDPQDCDWLGHRVYMTDEELKMAVKNGMFDYDVSEEAIKHKENFLASRETSEYIKQERRQIDGNDQDPYMDEKHVLIEWYGKMYVEPDVDEDDFDVDLEKLEQEVVAWVHRGSGKLLGWTYLHRISPSGIRPIFKSDFIKIPSRSNGAGVAEVLQDISNMTDTIYNMRIDNGTISSLPMGVYRSSSGLKPDIIKMQPGTLYPVDDVNDVRMIQFPFLSNFGYQETSQLQAMAENILTISELQLGRAPEKVGALRNATGANLLNTESNIQLEIHFDRVARTLSRLFDCLFQLCRERIPANLYYRVTSDLGAPIFGKVNREDLKGNYDFNINVDILGQSRVEQQQQATLLMQTLINPAFTNTGVVAPRNLYELAKNFLLKNRTSRAELYVTEPQDYKEFISTSERIFRIVTGVLDGLVESVRLDENHEKAIADMEGFRSSDQFGLLTTPEQVKAFNDVIQRHEQLMAAQQAGGQPNMAGMQVPRQGFSPNNINTLQAPPGEANGPVH